MMRITDKDAEDFVTALDEVCWQCAGSSSYRGKSCDICHGTGKRLTRAGSKLLEFLERHQTARSTTSNTTGRQKGE